MMRGHHITRKGILLSLIVALITLQLAIASGSTSRARALKTKAFSQHWKVWSNIEPANLQTTLDEINALGYRVSDTNIYTGALFTIAVSESDVVNVEEDDENLEDK